MKRGVYHDPKCECATLLSGICPVHGEIDFSETTYSRFRGWTDEHGARVSPPPQEKCLHCLGGWCEYHR